MSDNTLCASCCLPCCCHKRARLIVMRSSHDFACCFFAISIAVRKQASASVWGAGGRDRGSIPIFALCFLLLAFFSLLLVLGSLFACRSMSSPLRRYSSASHASSPLLLIHVKVSAS